MNKKYIITMMLALVTVAGRETEGGLIKNKKTALLFDFCTF